MSSPAKDLVDFILLSSSLVDVIGFGVDVFVGVQPNRPVDCVTLFNTGGWGNTPNYLYERPTVQVLVRSSDYETGYNLTESIKKCLHGKNNEEINNSRYVQIFCEGDIQDLGIDPENQTYGFSVNFATHRTNSM